MPPLRGAWLLPSGQQGPERDGALEFQKPQGCLKFSHDLAQTVIPALSYEPRGVRAGKYSEEGSLFTFAHLPESSGSQDAAFVPSGVPSSHQKVKLF